MTISLCACEKTEKHEDGAITVKVNNTVLEQITLMSASWAIDGETVGTTGVEVAGDEGFLGKDSFSFYIYSEDIENKDDLDKLTITIKVTDADGGTFDAATVSIPSEIGDEYEFELRYEDGCYSLWQDFGDGTYARLSG